MDKKLFRDILLIIGFVILLVTVVVKLDGIFGMIGKCVALLSPFLVGFGLAFILDRPVSFFTRVYRKLIRRESLRQRLSHGLGILTTYLLVIIVLVLAGVFMVPQLAHSISTLVGYMGRLQEVADWITTRLSLDPIDISSVSTFLKELIDNPAGIINQIFPYVYGFTSSVISFAANAILSVVTSIYLLADKKRLLVRCRKISYTVLPYRRAKRLGERMHLIGDTFAKFIDGQFTEAVILGVLCFFGMLLFRFDYALLISVIIATFNMIPYIGAWLGSIPAIFILLMTDKPLNAVWFVIFLITLQQIESNLIYPKVVGESVGLPALWVLLSVVVFGGLFGVVGMLIAVPIMSVVYRLLREYTGKRLRKKVDEVEPEDPDAAKELRDIAEIASDSPARKARGSQKTMPRNTGGRL